MIIVTFIIIVTIMIKSGKQNTGVTTCHIMLVLNNINMIIIIISAP